MWPFKSHKLVYTTPDRLADVLALIQVLALHGYRHRSEAGLNEDLQGGPRSSKNWTEVARQHPEFFRVSDADKLGISLVATHVLPKDENNQRKLPAGFLDTLLQTAITLHDRQLDRKHHWRAYIPIVVAITAGIFTIFGVFLKAWFDSSPSIPPLVR